MPLLNVLGAEHRDRENIVTCGRDEGWRVVEHACAPPPKQRSDAAGSAMWVVGAGGWGAARQAIALVRQANRSAIVVALTEHPTELLATLAEGANDGVCRPLRAPELFARLRACGHVARTSVLSMPAALVSGSGSIPLRMDSVTYTVRVGEVAACLRRAELNVLSYLLAQSPRVVSTHELLAEVLRTRGDGGAIRNHVWEIRRKLRAAGLPGLCITVKGVGYGLDLTQL